MSQLRIAVIGMGVMGANHVRVYSEIDSVDLVSVCDLNESAVKEVANRYRVNYYTHCLEMLRNEDLDAVSICVPTKLHKEVALVAIENKVNVLIEKPITSTVEEARDVIEAAKKNGIKLMVGHIERFNPVVIEVKKLVAKGDLGKIFLIKTERFSPFPKRIVDVGTTIDLSVHDIDVMQYLLGSKAKSVYSANAQRIHSSYEDLMTGTLVFADGTMGIISCNWVTPKIVRELTVIGEKGMYKADYLSQKLVFYKNEFIDKNIDWDKRALDVIPGEVINIDIEKKEPLKTELETFVKYISDGSDYLVSGEEGMASLNIALKFLESSKLNQVINL